MSDDLHRLLDGAPRYRATTRVRAQRLVGARTWRTANGSDLDAAAGDWLLTDGRREWTVDADVFARSYERLADGTFRKSTTVQAVQLDEAVDVPTLEGVSAAVAGDWLLRGVEGELWPVGDDHFRSRYAPDTGSELASWHDDDPRTVNAEIVPPRLRHLERAAAHTQRRSEWLQAGYLLTLVATPAVTYLQRSSGVAEEIVNRTAAVLLVVALLVRLGRQYRAPDGSWIRARRDLEAARSAAWSRAMTGATVPGDSVRGHAVGTAGVAERWRCYRRFRITDQIAWFTHRGGRHARAATRMRWLQGGLALLALAAAVFQAWWFEPVPVVGLMVALLAAAEAWSQFRRSAFIAASYRTTADELRRLRDREPAGEPELAEAVGAVEHLLERELWTWVAISSTAVLTERARGPAA